MPQKWKPASSGWPMGHLQMRSFRSSRVTLPPLAGAFAEARGWRGAAGSGDGRGCDVASATDATFAFGAGAASAAGVSAAGLSARVAAATGAARAGLARAGAAGVSVTAMVFASLGFSGDGRDARPSRWAFPITALRERLSPISSAIWLAERPSSHRVLSIAMRSSVQAMSILRVTRRRVPQRSAAPRSMSSHPCKRQIPIPIASHTTRSRVFR